MALKYDRLDQIEIGSSENMRPATMTALFGKLVENDISLLPGSGIEPQIWCCRWWNDKWDSSKYYAKGDAVWLNTESVQSFVAARENEIYQFASLNVRLARQAQRLHDDPSRRQEYLEFLVGVVTGSSGEAPLYELGSLSLPAQVMVSLRDGNNRPPTAENVEGGWWAEMFERQDRTDVEREISAAAADAISRRMAAHETDFHFAGSVLSSAAALEEKYLKNDFSNITGVQQFRGHRWYKDSMEGFDSIDAFEYQRSEIQNVQTPCGKWFRMWKSGWLEHGGVALADQDGVCRVGFKWGNAPLYDYQPDGLDQFYVCRAKIGGSDLRSDMNPARRYTIHVTRICMNDGFYTDVEAPLIYDIENDGFAIKGRSGDVYQYKCAGFTGRR